MAITWKKGASTASFPESNCNPIAVLLAVRFKVQCQTGHCNWITVVSSLVICITCSLLVTCCQTEALGTTRGQALTWVHSLTSTCTHTNRRMCPQQQHSTGTVVKSTELVLFFIHLWFCCVVGGQCFLLSCLPHLFIFKFPLIRLQNVCQVSTGLILACVCASGAFVCKNEEQLCFF